MDRVLSSVHCSPLPAGSVSSPLLPGEPPESTPLIQVLEVPCGLGGEGQLPLLAPGATPLQVHLPNLAQKTLPCTHPPALPAAPVPAGTRTALTVHQGSSLSTQCAPGVLARL